MIGWTCIYFDYFLYNKKSRFFMIFQQQVRVKRSGFDHFFCYEIIAYIQRFLVQALRRSVGIWLHTKQHFSMRQYSSSFYYRGIFNNYCMSSQSKMNTFCVWSIMGPCRQNNSLEPKMNQRLPRFYSCKLTTPYYFVGGHNHF